MPRLMFLDEDGQRITRTEKAKATDKQFILALIAIKFLLMLMIQKQETMQNMKKKRISNGIIISMQNSLSTQIRRCYHKRIHLS